MLPIRDVNPAQRRAIVTGGIIAVAAFVFFAVQPADPEAGTEFLYRAASIPCEVVTGEPLSVESITSGTCQAGGTPVFGDKNVAWSVVASIFFHGGLGHLLANLWVLWIFGNNVEDAMGPVGYALFYLGAGIAASAAHIVARPESVIPVVGASGAIAGVMGAYLVLFPHARVISIIPPLFFFPFQVPAVVFLGVWFLGQFAFAGAETNIAWEAHAAGFVVGVGYAFLRRRALRARLRPRPVW